MLIQCNVRNGQNIAAYFSLLPGSRPWGVCWLRLGLEPFTLPPTIAFTFAFTDPTATTATLAYLKVIKLLISCHTKSKSFSTFVQWALKKHRATFMLKNIENIMRFRAQAHIFIARYCAWHAHLHFSISHTFTRHAHYAMQSTRANVHYICCSVCAFCPDLPVGTNLSYFCSALMRCKTLQCTSLLHNNGALYCCAAWMHRMDATNWCTSKHYNALYWCIALMKYIFTGRGISAYIYCPLVGVSPCSGLSRIEAKFLVYIL